MAGRSVSPSAASHATSVRCVNAMGSSYSGWGVAGLSEGARSVQRYEAGAGASIGGAASRSGARSTRMASSMSMDALDGDMLTPSLPRHEFGCTDQMRPSVALLDASGFAQGADVPVIRAPAAAAASLCGTRSETSPELRGRWGVPGTALNAGISAAGTDHDWDASCRSDSRASMDHVQHLHNGGGTERPPPRLQAPQVTQLLGQPQPAMLGAAVQVPSESAPPATAVDGAAPPPQVPPPQQQPPQTQQSQQQQQQQPQQQQQQSPASPHQPPSPAPPTPRAQQSTLPAEHLTPTSASSSCSRGSMQDPGLSSREAELRTTEPRSSEAAHTAALRHSTATLAGSKRGREGMPGGSVPQARRSLPGSVGSSLRANLESTNEQMLRGDFSTGSAAGHAHMNTDAMSMRALPGE